jgi:hypothetical protein
MAYKFTRNAPFAYDNNYYLRTDKEKAEKEKFVSFMTQRDAKYKTPAQEVYNNKHLSDGELFKESFMHNIDPPTPQIKEIDGYDAEKTESTEEGEGTQNETNTNTEEPTTNNPTNTDEPTNEGDNGGNTDNEEGTVPVVNNPEEGSNNTEETQPINGE